MRSPRPLKLALGLLLVSSALLGAVRASAHGALAEARQILLPSDRPEQIILATTFGLIVSEDAGSSWFFSCERGNSSYAGPYLLGAPPPNRVFAMTGSGMIYSDDDSCSWTSAGASASDVLPYAFTVDPANSQRVYVIGVPLADLGAGGSIYVSGDGGLTLGDPVFTTEGDSALLNVLVAPGQPHTLLAAMFSRPENHPTLLRSLDSGEHWEVAADLVDSLGENPFELLAIDPIDEDRVYVRILEPSTETLAISEDGGQSFVPSVSIPGRLNAFLQLSSGAILVGGTAGSEPVGYRSDNGGHSFEPWPEAPRVHALAERDGKVYIAADNFADGYALAESDDEGAHLKPLLAFDGVRSVKSCLADTCAESCAYYASIELWPAAVCGAESGSAATATAADASASAGADGGDVGAAGDAESVDAVVDHSGSCAFSLVQRNASIGWTALLVLASISLTRLTRRFEKHAIYKDSRKSSKARRAVLGTFSKRSMRDRAVVARSLRG
jgi:photosystem II stability/assembly factor-like uncharacterized protein